MIRTMIFLDPEDHRALFEIALEESRQAGRRVGMSDLIRRAVKAYLQERERAAGRGGRKAKGGK